MIIMANWWQGSLKAAMGDAFSDIATAPIPVGPNGDGSHPVSYEWLTIVNGKATPEQQDAAWRFLQFLHGPESGDDRLRHGRDPHRHGHHPQPHERHRPRSRTSCPTRSSRRTWTACPNAVPFPMILGGQELSEMLQKKLEAIMFGELTAADAAAQAQSEAEQILGQYYP